MFARLRASGYGVRSVRLATVLLARVSEPRSERCPLRTESTSEGGTTPPTRSADEFWCVQGRTCGNAGLQRTRWRPGGVARRAFGPGDGVYESLVAVTTPKKFRPCDRRQPSSWPLLSPSVVLYPLPIVLHGLQPPCASRRLFTCRSSEISLRRVHGAESGMEEQGQYHAMHALWTLELTERRRSFGDL